MKIKAIIFDLNGIFVKSEYLSKRIERRYGIPEDKFIPVLKKVMKIARKPGIGDSFSLWKPHLENLGLSFSKENFFHFWFSGEKVIPEMIELAKSLRKRGLKVFILSSNFKERTDFYRQKFPEIFKSVDNVYFSHKTGFVKPNKRAFQNILEKNNLKPNECLYFDDQSENVRVAKDLGINAHQFIDLKQIRGLVEKF